MPNNHEVEYGGETKIDRFARWIKGNLLNFIILALCVVYLTTGLISVVKNDTNIFNIIALVFVALLVGVSISSLLAEKGIKAGIESPKYVDTMDGYEEQIDKSEPFIDKLDRYCLFKEAIVRERARTKILRKAGLKYSEIFDSEGKLIYTFSNIKWMWMWKNRHLRKKESVIRKAVEVRVYGMTASSILCESDEDVDLLKKEETLGSKRAKDISFDFVVKLVTAIVGSIYTAVYNGINLGSIIWATIQIVLWLGLGTLKYFNNYDFIVNKFRHKIIRKTNYLIEFQKLLAIDPHRFDEVKKVIEPIKVEIPQGVK